MALKTDYKDDKLDSSVNPTRRWNLKSENGEMLEEKCQLEDVSVYEEEGDVFGAADINATNRKVNELDTGLSNVRVYVSEDEKLHFVDKDGADTELPFKSGLDKLQVRYTCTGYPDTLCTMQGTPTQSIKDNFKYAKVTRCSVGSGSLTYLRAYKPDGSYFNITVNKTIININEISLIQIHFRQGNFDSNVIDVEYFN